MSTKSNGDPSEVKPKRKPAKTSPTVRSLAWHRERGHIVCKTEHWNAFARRRIDLYGFIDMVVMDEERGLLGVQVTTTSNMWSREQKILSSREATAWLNKGLRIRIEGWSKKGDRGKVKHWTLTTKDITL